MATVNRKVKSKNQPQSTEGERVLYVASLIDRVRNIVEESGDPQGFDATAWVSRWLNEPLPALGGSRPFDLLNTMDGQELVSSTLAQIQSSAYS